MGERFIAKLNIILLAKKCTLLLLAREYIIEIVENLNNEINNK